MTPDQRTAALQRVFDRVAHALTGEDVEVIQAVGFVLAGGAVMVRGKDESYMQKAALRAFRGPEVRGVANAIRAVTRPSLGPTQRGDA